MLKPASQAIPFWPFLPVGLVAIAGCGGWGRAVEKTGPVLLITQEEAALPDESPTRAPRKLPKEGPRIEIERPENGQVYVGLFPIDVTFSPGPKGLDVVGVYHPKPPRSVDAEQIASRARGWGYSGRLAIDQDGSELERCYGQGKQRKATSVSLLVDAAGVIRFVHPGPVLFPSREARYAKQDRDYRLLEAAIRILLAEGARRE